MRRPLVTALLASALAASLATPAAAHPVPVFLDCDVTYGSFGTGATQGNGICIAVGAASGPVHLSFSAFEPSATCPLTGTAAGTMFGAVTGNFTWTRVLTTGVVSATGTHPGSGPMTFVENPPTPTGPCGRSNARFHVTMLL